MKREKLEDLQHRNIVSNDTLCRKNGKIYARRSPPPPSPTTTTTTRPPFLPGTRRCLACDKSEWALMRQNSNYNR